MARFTIATWNVNSIRVRLSQVLDWLKTNQPDILALQETKVIDASFPWQDFQKIGYQAYYAGQKTYNGVAFLSKNPLGKITTDLPNLQDLQRRILGATYKDIYILNLYVPNGERVGSEKYFYKLDWLKKIRDYLEQSLYQYPKLIVLGDFNIAPTDDDVYDPTQWCEKILCSTTEREQLKGILDLGFCDSFRLFSQELNSFSWWDYRKNGFVYNRGLRIDLILISKALQSYCNNCKIDKTPRSLDRPSDHAPVVCLFN
ncbi:exodeoxyribonuclease III [Candidatus Nitrosacidococcus tergens]|uniref:Exodeoxyribonuclease III n=1 Tax=Candidatus Nitrosacidococcus tergens TaxID=553981 RepID=A0A7G1QC60_9GAMM|nr:exodeoxyribonuclease III [Candidatus Nitrosacidococcus tergens]CAB1277179.1 Exodeoxyribonuclease III [Candidatus Nitrosacidococcus tergens]